MKVLRIIPLLFIISLVGCSKNDNPVSSDNTHVNSGDILPLAVGNEWIYIDEYFSANGSPENTDTVKLGITGKTNITYQGKSVEVFYWNWYYGDQPDELKMLCRNEEDGCYSYGLQRGDNKLLLQKSLWLKYPVTVGDSWKMFSYAITDSSMSIADTVTYSCRSVNEKFNTLKGEMECYGYYSRTNDHEGHKYEQFTYFAKNVGYVGFVYKIDDVVREKYTLLSYSLSGNALKSAPLAGRRSSRKKTSFPITPDRI